MRSVDEKIWKQIPCRLLNNNKLVIMLIKAGMEQNTVWLFLFMGDSIVT